MASVEGFLLPLTIRIITDGLTAGDFNSLLMGTLLGIGGFILFGFGGYFYQVSMAKLIKSYNVNVKTLAYKHFLQYYSEDGKERGSDRLSFIQNDLKLLEDNYVTAYMRMIQTVLLASVAIIYVAVTNVTLSAIFIAFAFMLMILPRFTQPIIQRASREWTKQNEQTTKELTEDIQGAPSIKSYGREETFFRRLKHQFIHSEDSLVQMTKAQGGSNTAAYVLSMIASIIPLFIGGLFVLNGHIAVGALISIFMASDRIANPLTVAVQCYNKLATTKDIRQKLTTMAAETDPHFQQYTYDQSILPIQLNHVSFSHGDTQIFDNLDLAITSSEKILLMGQSGSGKTTFLKIIQGLLQVDSGEVTYDGQVLDNQALKQHISYIRQKPIIFDDSIAFNIMLGEDFSDQSLQEAIELAGLTDLIQDKGLDYVVGEQGKHLSGGQNQRIEIARAIIRQRQVLIADEITAALDNRTAHSIHRTLFNLPQTVIEVNHHTTVEQLSQYDAVYQLEGNRMNRVGDSKYNEY